METVQENRSQVLLGRTFFPFWLHTRCELSFRVFGLPRHVVCDVFLVVGLVSSVRTLVNVSLTSLRTRGWH